MIYTDISEVPLDAAPAADVKDVPDDEKPATLQIERLLVSAAAPSPSYVIPFRRTIKKGSVGKDVVGAKRAIWKANGLAVPKGATTTFGSIAVKQLRGFQHRHGLNTNGELDPGTLVKLAPYFDAFAFLLYVGYPPGTSAAQAKRNAFEAYMVWGYNNRGLLHYAQQRPMDLLNDLQHLPGWDDCSEWFTKGCKYANIKDPNGLNFNGLGWTGTLAAHGKLVVSGRGAYGAATVGCAVLYGPGPNFEHVAGYVGHGRVVSFGGEIGPLLLPIDYRSDRGMIRTYI